MANDTLDTLNSFLRGEISAVETYRQAIEKLRDKPEVSTLSECLRSHEQRVSLLRDEIRLRGGEPAQGSGPWGAFVKLLEGGAKLFGAKSAIAALALSTITSSVPLGTKPSLWIRLSSPSAWLALRWSKGMPRTL